MLQGSSITLAVFAVLLLGCNRAHISSEEASDLQEHLDQHCAGVGRDSIKGEGSAKQMQAFYSSKVNTCVQVVENDTDWSYTVRDLTHGFFADPKWINSDMPLRVYDDERYGLVSVEGIWKATDKASDKQLVSRISAKIECERQASICKESDATIFMGLLQPDKHDYTISSWTSEGIIADDADEGPCSIGHRLVIDSKSNSVIVTDYPKKSSSNDCEAFQNANSYALKGGSFTFSGFSTIFSCTKDGADSAILDKVDALHGDVLDKPYRQWMDNGEGGLPATEKTPEHPYQRSDCARLLEKKVQELKKM